MSAEIQEKLNKLDLILIDLDQASVFDKPAKIKRATQMMRTVLNDIYAMTAAHETKINVILRGLSLHAKS